MTEYFTDDNNQPIMNKPIPDYYYDHWYNEDSVEIEEKKIDPTKELTEYFIQFRHDDILDVQDTKELTIDINENPILQLVLLENSDEFRNIIRDSVARAVALTCYNRDDMEGINSINGIKNNIALKIDFPINVKLSDLSASDYEDELVTFEADVSYWSNTRNIVYNAVYKCPDCGYTQNKKYKVKWNDLFCSHCKVPLEYYKALISEDSRRVKLREMTNVFSGGHLPASITADLYGKTVFEAKLSDKMIVTGIFRSVPLRKENGKINQEFIPTIQVISLKNMKTVVEMPDELLKKKFYDLEKSGKLIDAIIDGYAPNIYKKRNEKKALICSLIRSMWVGSRGDGGSPMINILFVGDGGTFKSTLMKYGGKVSDVFAITDSTTISSAGVIAIAIKSESGEWSTKAGLLPMYNGGTLFMDEFGDMNPEIYADLKTGTVNGYVSKNVGGENFNALAETAIWASMNPINGVYDNSKTIKENLGKLEQPLITRFDLLVKFGSEFNDEYEDEIQDHMDNHDNIFNLTGKKPSELLTDHEIKLFLNYVRELKPEVTKEALQTRSDFFKKIKEKNPKKTTDTRTKNSILKFAIALAKWHLSDKVLPRHVEEALELYSEATMTFNRRIEDGEFIDEKSLKTTQDGRRTALSMAYDSLKDKNGYAFPDEVITMACASGVFTSRGQAESLVNTLRMEGKLTEKDKQIKISWS